jgi:hypothetical protein
MVPIKRMNYRDAPDNRIVFEHEPAGFWLLRWRFGFLIRFVVFFVTVRRFALAGIQTTEKDSPGIQCLPWGPGYADGESTACASGGRQFFGLLRAGDRFRYGRSGQREVSAREAHLKRLQVSTKEVAHP